MKKEDTSWNAVAQWYRDLLEGEGTYQKELILPNLLRLMAAKKSEVVVDLACGPGFFSREFSKAGAQVIGVDASEKLIAAAQKTALRAQFHVSRADALGFLKDEAADKIAIVLAIQNIENAAGVFRECARVLKPQGKLFIVLNHPVFRIPEVSRWDWDSQQAVQYRRIDAYLSERKSKIRMHPGKDPSRYTISFHRPLQFYFKALRKAGFAVTGLEEWNSERRSGPGPRAAAENRARKEIPLFLALVAEKGTR